MQGLFGLFSYDIPLKLEDRITIIHGPNGCGKTTILKMLFSLFARRFGDVASTNFITLVIGFDNDHRLEIVRHLNEQTIKYPRKQPRSRQQYQLEFTLTGDPEHKSWKWLDINESVGIPLEMIEHHLPFLSRIDRHNWIDQRSDEILTLDEVITQFSEQLPFIRRTPGQEMPQWLKAIIDSVEVHFIQTQRLLRLGPSSRASPNRTAHRAMVLEYSEEAVAHIRSALAESVQQSQVLDRNFPVRVLRGQANAQVTTDQVRARYAEQEQKRRRLEAAGLISWQMEVALPDKDLETLERQLLWLYLDDMDKKLAVFDLLLQKIEFLTEMINARFLHKSFKIDREKGFVFTSKGATESAQIPLESLSSGEQHELVLSFELLFRVKSGSFILIDEPELSLHVGWQHRFLEDLARISELAGLDFLVATHSPQIIHKRWDLALSLGETE